MFSFFVCQASTVGIRLSKLHKERDYFYFTHYCISSSLQSTGHILFVYIFLCWTLLNKQYMNQNLLVWQQIYIFLNQIDITTLAEILERGKKKSLRASRLFFCHSFLYFSHMYKHNRKQVINNSVFEQMFMTHNQKHQNKSGTFSNPVSQTILE